MKYIVVGCGSIGKRHIRNLLECKAETVIGVDTREDRREEAAALGVQVNANLQDVIGEGDAVVVALPNSLHRTVIEQAIESKAHLLVEKPVDTQSEGWDSLIAKFNDYAGVGHVGAQRRRHRRVH